jgi:hypothetical protein
MSGQRWEVVKEFIYFGVKLEGAREWRENKA